MVDEPLQPQALPPDQLRQLAQIVLEGMRGDFQALFKATAQAPAFSALGRPPADFDGIDARLVDKLKSEVRDVVLSEVREVVREEVEKLRTEVFEIFDDMDMPLDKGDKRKATREKLEGLFAMHRGSKEFKTELWKSIRAAIIGQITLVVLAVLAFFGIKGAGH